MRQAGTLALFTYWDQLRRGRAAPERAEVDPVAIRNVLADTFMLEVDSARTYPVCLSGTRLNALFDDELKDRSFLSLWTEDQRAEVRAMLDIVTDGASPVVAGAACAPVGYEKADLELLLLPLRHHGKTHARVLGHIASAKRIPWLGLLPIEPLTFRSLRVLDRGEDTSMRAVRHSRPGDGEPAFEQRGHLRIYSGNA